MFPISCYEISKTGGRDRLNQQAPATFQQHDKNLVWVASLCYSQSVLAALSLRIFNSKRCLKIISQGLQKKKKPVGAAVCVVMSK